MKVVGLTGIMGSGKSSVAQELSKLSVPLYNCDSRAKELMDSELKCQLITIVGEGLFDAQGRMNRGYMADRIFNSSYLRNEVERLVHSALREDMLEWIAAQGSSSRYVVVESAILYGSIIEQDMDIVVAVLANEDEIIGRVMARDGITEKQVQERLKCQLSQSELRSRATLTIYTANSEALTPKVINLNEKLLTLCP